MLNSFVLWSHSNFWNLKVPQIIIWLTMARGLKICFLFNRNIIWDLAIFQKVLDDICNGWDVCVNGTTSVPKSVLRYVVDKVRLFVSIWGFLFQCKCLEIKVPNKFFAKFCCKFLAFLKLFCPKSTENDYFDQCLEGAAPKTC